MTTGSGAPLSAAAVANEFLRLGAAEPNLPQIDQMKLQKLIFYAHAWHLAFRKQPLFEEDVEAWPWGPVVRSVYGETRKYGRGAVTIELTVPTVREGHRLAFEAPQVENPDTRAFIKSVWDTIKRYTGIQLSNSTHEPGEPWTVIKDLYGSLDGKPLIPNEVIREIFTKKLQTQT